MFDRRIDRQDEQDLRTYGFTDADRISTGVSTALAAPIAWCFGFSPLFRPCTPRRAYADLPTVLTIVHFDGTHPIPPHYYYHPSHSRGDKMRGK